MSPPRRPPLRGSSAPMLRTYDQWYMAWARPFARDLRAAVAVWRRDRLPKMRPGRVDSEDNDEIDEALSSREAADLAYWLSRRVSGTPAPPPPDPAQVRADGSRAAAVTEAGQRRRMVEAGASPPKLATRLGIEPDRLLTIDIAPTRAAQDLLVQWTREGLDLITRIPPTVLQDMDVAISTWAREGARVQTIRDELVGRLGIGRRHAELIARDQIGKLNGAVTQSMQRAAQVDAYNWRNVGDERVRGNPGGRYPKAKPSHWTLEGTRHQWDDPPVAGPGTQRGHPGEAIQCRCYADPVIPDDLLPD